MPMSSPQMTRMFGFVWPLSGALPLVDVNAWTLAIADLRPGGRAAGVFAANPSARRSVPWLVRELTEAFV